LGRIGHNLTCAFCGKAWYEVDCIVTKGDSSICDVCVRELSGLIVADVGLRRE
jgi:hypothetical protein